jgi:hypothetical protein
LKRPEIHTSSSRPKTSAGGCTDSRTLARCLTFLSLSEGPVCDRPDRPTRCQHGYLRRSLAARTLGVTGPALRPFCRSCDATLTVRACPRSMLARVHVDTTCLHPRALDHPTGSGSRQDWAPPQLDPPIAHDQFHVFTVRPADPQPPRARTHTPQWSSCTRISARLQRSKSTVRSHRSPRPSVFSCALCPQRRSRDTLRPPR